MYKLLRVRVLHVPVPVPVQAIPAEPLYYMDKPTYCVSTLLTVQGIY